MAIEPSLKFKFDENMPVKIRNIPEGYGYNVHTVNDEGINGIQDRKLMKICNDEERILVTTDHGFIEHPRYDKNDYYGIIYLDLHSNHINNVKIALESVFKGISHKEFVDQRIHCEQLFKNSKFFRIVTINY